MPIGDPRGVQWRIDLGILPSSPDPSIDHLRRVTADSRRRYASLRRQLLIDPHVPKDSNSPDFVMDNPLSQNPDSMWSRFFRNAELERTVDQDLSRLYPEHGSYFQTPGCQAMLRRILLLWCLRHPEFGYRQGMHELLAPLLYVLQADIEQLSEVRNLYEDHFADKFDGFSFHENDFSYKFDFQKISESEEDENRCESSPLKIMELDPKIQRIVLLSDAYGSEGELGILLSEKFMEHDAYCMFDVLMNGAGGAVAMAEFFSHSPCGTGFPPVIEASAALYHLLSLIDSSLHSHLVELGVEPQYFALRWLRVLFGREFALEDLLIIWDEIFACENEKLEKSFSDSSCSVLNSNRGAFISAYAVTMILHLRPSLLATENATVCLQRLLNFPDDTSLEKLIAKAKSLQALAMDANNSTPLVSHYGRSKSTVVRGHSHSIDLTSQRTPLYLVPESYWEEKWRVVHKEEEHKQNSIQKRTSKQRKGWSEKFRLRLTKTESDPSPSKVDNGRKGPKLSVRKNLLKDLAQELGSDDVNKYIGDDNVREKNPVAVNVQDGDNRDDLTCASEQTWSSRNAASDSDPPSPIGHAGHPENRSESSVASIFYADENNVDASRGEVSGTHPGSSPLPIFDSVCLKSEHDDASGGKCTTGLKEQKFLSGKFQRFWKFGQNADERTSERSGLCDSIKACNGGNNLTIPAESSTADASHNNEIIRGETVDQSFIATLRNFGQSMRENIQVIESEFQQDQVHVGTFLDVSKNDLAGKSRGTAMTALEELRKISNLLSEM
ncbi:hypothetical protein K7X08_032646 [Anisodus acutangulus]|uniref:Rab-GAP TBC domain-containing protein n=1 Tax=Anisodus acutangulus TaxID=402998 RepID=A0A9Q1RA99_9SOLA|nr:hypothetical protein K7X08_032646 [Anisodus acutangulus]